jgi:hypothetical protein
VHRENDKGRFDVINDGLLNIDCHGSPLKRKRDTVFVTTGAEPPHRVALSIGEGIADRKE